MNLTSQQRDDLRPFQKEAYGLLSEITAIKENLKDVVETAANKTGIDKAVVSQHFTLAYKGGLDELQEKVAMQEFLMEGV